MIPFAKAKVEEKAASKTPPAIESIPAPGKVDTAVQVAVYREKEKGRVITYGGVCDRCSSF